MCCNNLLLVVFRISISNERTIKTRTDEHRGRDSWTKHVEHSADFNTIPSEIVIASFTAAKCIMQSCIHTRQTPPAPYKPIRHWLLLLKVLAVSDTPVRRTRHFVARMQWKVPKQPSPWQNHSSATVISGHFPLVYMVEMHLWKAVVLQPFHWSNASLLDLQTIKDIN